MRRNSLKRLELWSLLAGLMWLAGTPAYAQIFHRGRTDCPPEPCPPGVTPQVPAPSPVPPSTTVPPAPTGRSDLSGLEPESSLALGAPTVAADSSVGYIDSAIPRSLLRVRVDSAFDDNRPDRAEFFYAKCGCFGGNAAGPGKTAAADHVDFVDVSAYLEAALNNRLSGFIEVPLRFIELDSRQFDPALRNFSGIADINAGFKAALIADPCQYLTFQLRTFAPTGDSHEGLGTNHVSLEPALLAYQKLTDRLRLEAELRDWIPIGGSDFAGNVLRYGVGASYDVYRTQCLRIAPVVELVGWTVLSGKEFNADTGQTLEAEGDTIVNAKFGVRATFGAHSDLYLGYGRALTGDVWYKEIFRLEYRLIF